MASESMEDPEYITFLLDPKKKYDCYFVVGNGNENTPVETIGAVKKFLLAHSLVFRKELDESELKESGNGIEITDIFPDTFRNLLRFMYGFNNCASLSFDDAQDLLYAADKYMVKRLKDCLATRLLTLLSLDNICSLMNNPVCVQELEINNEITKIIQYETKQVLASPLFLGLCPNAFLSILEQKQLQIAEIELWRSALKWAKHRAKSDDGPMLRKELKTHLPHLRVCTVSLQDFCRDVVCSRVLTEEEAFEVCLFHGNKDHKPELKEISDTTQSRTEPPLYENICSLSLNISCHFRYLKETTPSQNYTIVISTLENAMEFTSFNLYNRNNYQQGNCTVKIDKVGSDGPGALVSVTGPLILVQNSYIFDMPVQSNDTERIILHPNSKYNITVSSSTLLDVFYSNENASSYESSHFIVSFSIDGGKYVSCIQRIHYKLLKPSWVPFVARSNH